MKILGIFFQLICLLVLLLAAAVYAAGDPETSLQGFVAQFTPEQIQAVVQSQLWLPITAGVLLLLALLRGMGIAWNIVLSLSCLAFIAEVTLAALGPELALPSPLRGMGWEDMLTNVTATYPVPALLIPVICVLGSICATSPGRITLTSGICYGLCYGCAALLYYLMLQWMLMEEPPMHELLDALLTMPWLLASVPAAFFLQYCLLMAIFDAFAPERRKKKNKVEPKEDEVSIPVVNRPATASSAEADAPTVRVDTPTVKVDKPTVRVVQPAAAQAAKAPAAKPEQKKADDPPTTVWLRAPKPETAKPATVSDDAPTTVWPKHLRPDAPKAEAPAEPAKAETPAEPAKAETPAEPVKPEAPAEPAKPEAPAEPAKAETPAEPAKPETPTLVRIADAGQA